MTPQEFCDRYLPDNWCERDLQLLIQKRLRRWRIFQAPDEVRIHALHSTRRSDLELWFARIEIKKWLTYFELKSAVGQLLLYDHYGSKIVWLFSKIWVVVGIAPADPQEYESVRSLAEDYRAMGIRIIFINECPSWGEPPSLRLGWLLVPSVAFVALVTAYLIVATR